MREIRNSGFRRHVFCKSRPLLELRILCFLQRSFSLTIILICVLPSAIVAQQTRSSQRSGVTIQGKVLNSVGKSIDDASVWLEQEGTLKPVETKTNAAGVFAFTAVQPGRYLLRAEKSGQRSQGSVVLASSQEGRKIIDLVLENPSDLPSKPNFSSPSTSQAMEFSDQPNFAIAGVVDWTAVGGHGSDSALRTSEDLAQEILTLKPESSSPRESNSPTGASEGSASEGRGSGALAGAPGSFERNFELGEINLRAGRYRDSIPLFQAAYRIDPTKYDNAYDLALAYKGAGDFSEAREQVQTLLMHRDSADLYRLAGELDEKLHNPLAAVQEVERAVRLDPSEQNYFEWGSELLLHRAVWQAAEVFKNGIKAYPKSSRMFTALGASLFAGAMYDEAALRLCEASDLNPMDFEPYMFMGKIEKEAPAPLPCVEEKLARFLQKQPENPRANYLYAMAVWKRQAQSPNQQALHQVEALLTKAVTIDPNCVDADLQLGILHFSQRDYTKAIGFYKKAIEVDPQLGEAHYRLGVAYDRTGEQAKANEEFRLHDLYGCV